MWPWVLLSPAESLEPWPEQAAGDPAKSRLHELVFVQLMHEVENGAPGARLSATLRAALERMSPAEREGVVSRVGGAGGAALFLAARRGSAEMCEYLVHVCGAPLEQRGAFSAAGERAPHAVTPLWAAAVAGRLRALRVLADAGADIDARSDSGSTPLRSACFMTHLGVYKGRGAVRCAETVQFLCERGADVHARNFSGGTCLINGVQCARLTRFLLAHGAAVNAQDAHGKTALHYAIQEHRVDTARVLLEGGASVHVTSTSGDDALRTAALRGAPALVRLVCDAARFPPARLADAHELLGATQLDEFDDVPAALASWRRATHIRHSSDGYVEKSACAAAWAAMGGTREWRTPDQLDDAAEDAGALRDQASLVTARVLGHRHKDTLLRLMYRYERELRDTEDKSLNPCELEASCAAPTSTYTSGAWFADAGQFSRCLDLWTWALQVRLGTDSLLHSDTCHTLCALTRLLVDLWVASCRRVRGEEGPWQAQDGELGRRPARRHIIRVLRLVLEAVPEAQRMLALQPRCSTQTEAWERALRCLVHIAVLADAASDTESHRDRDELMDLVRTLVSYDVRSIASGESLLHMVCSRVTAVRSAYFATEPRPLTLFPCARAARMLLAAGAAPAPRDHVGRTPLHIAASLHNFSTDLIEALVGGGAHVCTPDEKGAAPLDSAEETARDLLWSRVTLACRAARALMSSGAAPPAEQLPQTLLPFLELHR